VQRHWHPDATLFKLTGSGCSGKTTLAYATVGRLRQIVVHHFDELGAPEGADLHWRHRMTEMWVRRALEYHWMPSAASSGCSGARLFTSGRSFTRRCSTPRSVKNGRPAVPGTNQDQRVR
jgi:hypothetical protein